jgi:hypothetical protein
MRLNVDVIACRTYAVLRRCADVIRHIVLALKTKEFWGVEKTVKRFP